MKVRLRTGRTALFLAMLALALVLLLPLRLVLGWTGVGDQGLTARAVRGSVWSGRLREARFGDVVLGDLDARLSPLALLAGRARLHLASRAEVVEPRIDGTLVVSRSILGADDVTGTIPVGRALAPLPIAAVDLADVSVRFVDGECESAEGRVRATLAATLPGVAPGQVLSGPARCDGDALALPLVDAGGTGGADLRLWADGRYRAELTVTPGDPAAATALEAAGFVATANGYRLSAEGRF